MDANKTILKIEKIMKYYSLSAKEFSLKTGIQKSIVDEMINCDQMVTLTIVRQICAAFPQINARWLLLGEGAFLNGTTKDIHTFNKLKINIFIEDYKLPLEIARESEEFYRQAGKCLNEKINACKLEHPEIDIERILKLVGFYFALETVRNEYINNSNQQESPTNISQYRQAAINFRENWNLYFKKFFYYEHKKLYSIIAYQFAFNYQRSLIDK